MAKIDVANEIVQEFPEQNYNAEELANGHTEKELRELQEHLRSDGNATPLSDVEEGSIEASEDTEKAADEVLSAAVEGKETGKKYKLADPKTSYSELNFTLVSDQEKELPKNPSAQLRERIRSGYIIEV